MIESYLIGKYNNQLLYANCRADENACIAFKFFTLHKNGKIDINIIDEFSFLLLEDAKNSELVCSIANKYNDFLKLNQKLIIKRDPRMTFINDKKAFVEFRKFCRSNVSYDYCVALQNEFDKAHLAK